MKHMKIIVPVIGAGLLAIAYFQYGWRGVALVAGGILMYLLLNFTRAMTVLRRAADRPVGHAASAVMLNAKLKPGMALLHVVAMTRALGELRSPKDVQPELYRWTDSGGSWVDAEFHGGRLRVWSLTRPDAAAGSDAADA